MRETPLAVTEDLVLLLQACSAAVGESTLESVRSQVGPDVRFHDGYVVQHLIAGPCTVSQLAGLLGISQQAASKQVADLLERDLVTKRRSPGDRRSWQVELSPRGRDAVDAARRARRGVRDRCAAALGAESAEALLDGLRALSDHLAAADTMSARRLRPEADR